MTKTVVLKIMLSDNTLNRFRMSLLQSCVSPSTKKEQMNLSILLHVLCSVNDVCLHKSNKSALDDNRGNKLLPIVTNRWQEVHLNRIPV